MLIYLNNIFELISVFVAIIYYPYLKHTRMKWFLPFLLFIAMGELIVNYQAYVLRIPTRALNYLIGAVESIFYGYIFYHLTQNVGLKKLIFFFVPASVIAYCIGYLLFGRSGNYLIASLIASGFFLVGIALWYLFDAVIYEDKAFLTAEPGFWLALGISLFYSGISISFVLWKIIYLHDLSLFGFKLYNLIPQVMCVVLYSCISICLISCKKKSKISF